MCEFHLFIMFLNVFVRWYVIFTVIFLIVHSPIGLMCLLSVCFSYCFLSCVYGISSAVVVMVAFSYYCTMEFWEYHGYYLLLSACQCFILFFIIFLIQWWPRENKHGVIWVINSSVVRLGSTGLTGLI